MKIDNPSLLFIILCEVWLVMFPFHRGMFEKIAAHAGANPIQSQYILIAFFFVSVFAFTFFTNERNLKQVLLWGLSSSLLLSILMFFSPNSILFSFASAFLGISSGLFISAMNYMYIFGFSQPMKIKITAAIMLSLYVIMYLLNIINFKKDLPILFIISLFILILNLWITLKFNVINVIPQSTLQVLAFPKKLVILICIFMFSVSLNNGLISSKGLDSFSRFENSYIYLNNIPAIFVAATVLFYNKRIDRFVLAYFGLSCMGISYVSDIAFSYTMPGLFVSYIFMSASSAFFDLFMWTLAGDISLKYGRTLNVFRAVILSFMIGSLSGETLGAFIFHNTEKYHLLVIIISLLVLFANFTIMPWFNKYISKELEEPDKNKGKTESDEEKWARMLSQALSILPSPGTLTPRETEITGFLLRGHSNVQVIEMLFISENTLKVHTRHVYQKFGVSNRKELIKLVSSSGKTHTME